jgi:hypothetical protein
MDIHARLKGIDPNPDELVVGLEVGRAAGYKKPGYFVNTYYYGAPAKYTKMTTVASGVVSCQKTMGIAIHFYLVDGQVVTHPVSAGAVRENIRLKVRSDPKALLRFKAISWQRHYSPSSGSLLGPSTG